MKIKPELGKLRLEDQQREGIHETTENPWGTNRI